MLLILVTFWGISKKVTWVTEDTEATAQSDLRNLSKLHRPCILHNPWKWQVISLVFASLYNCNIHANFKLITSLEVSAQKSHASLNNLPDNPHCARQPGGAVRPGGAGGPDDDRPDGGPRQDIRAGGPGEAREPKGNVKLCSYYDVINCQLRTKASLPKSHIFWPFTTFSTGWHITLFQWFCCHENKSCVSVHICSTYYNTTFDFMSTEPR